VSQELQPDDRTILAAIEALERGGDAFDLGADADETAETLARLYSEVLGLIPYELEPVAPDPAVKQRLMAAVAGEGVQTETPQVPAPRPAPVAAPAPPPAAVVPPAQETPAPVPVSREVRAAPRPPVRSRPPRRWPLLLAASLALIFAGSSAWLYDQWITAQAKTTQLGQLLEEERRRGQEKGPVEELRAEVASLREKLDMVTTPAVEVSPLRPEGKLQPAARGLLFVAADHQHWYLNMEGLQPADADKVYQLWWMAGNTAESGGTFIARPGERIELSSETMPVGTTEAVVTLENAGGAPVPTGPVVLRSTGIRQLS
jgi:Anti-sigma-K factor rskA